MNLDVTIVGAGLVGASLAAGLLRSGLGLALIDTASERAPGDALWDARIYAISPGSRSFLEQCGAWARIPGDRIARVRQMLVHGDAGDAKISFDAYHAGLPELCFIVESRAIEQALRAVIAEAGELLLLSGARPVELALAEDAAMLQLEDGRGMETKLVIGADGAQSWVRESAGIEASARSYGQQGVVANFETERGHGDIARQWFRADGVLALLPLPGNRVSMVWSTWDTVAERLLVMDRSDLAREVETACAHALGSLRVLTPARGFPLQKLRVSECVRPRLALVGDAAHVVHPLAGQGVNLGFQDARELVHVLKSRGAQDDCGDLRLLRRYARARSEPVALMQATTDGLHRLFNASTPGSRWLRNAGLRLTNGVVPLKRLLTEQALG